MFIRLHLLRFAAIVLGIICLSISIFLYENQEGRVQSKLENFWIKIDDLQKATISKHLGFIRVVSEGLLTLLNRVFGEKFFSTQLLSVSGCYAIAILYFFLYGATLYIQDRFRVIYLKEPINLIYYAGIAFLYGTIPAFLKNRKGLAIWTVLLCYLIYKEHIQGTYTFNLKEMSLTLNPEAENIVRLIFISVPIVGSIVLTIYLFFVRISLINLSKSCSTIWVGIIFLINLFPVFFLLVILSIGEGVVAQNPPLREFTPGLNNASILNRMQNFGLIESIFTFVGLFFLTLLVITTFFLISTASFVVLSISLLLHRLSWPIFERPIYLLQRYGVAKRNKLTATCGLILITIGFGKIEALEKIVDKLLPF